MRHFVRLAVTDEGSFSKITTAELIRSRVF